MLLAGAAGAAHGASILPRPKFYWGTGIENCWIAQVDPKRDGKHRLLDVFLQMQHYDKWKQDLDLLPQAGANCIRYSVPWYKAEPKPGVYDWSWIDQPIDYLVNKLKIIPIMDIIHYGTPAWMADGIADARFPDAIARYAGAMATHFKGLVNHYSPHNEPQVTCYNCGLNGRWPPYWKGAEGWAKVGLQAAKGMVLETQAIRAAVPDAVIVSVDPLLFYRADPALPEIHPGEPESLAFYLAATAYPASLAYGKVSAGDRLGTYLQAHGVSAADLAWFQKHGSLPDIVGYNNYPDGFIYKPFGDFSRKAKVPLAEAAREAASFTKRGILDAYNYFGRPVYLTETSAGLTTEAKVAYIEALGEMIAELRREKIPIVGVNWWPLFNTIQWDYREAYDKPLASFIYGGRWNNGLCVTEPQPNGDLKRVPTPALSAYARVGKRVVS